MIRVMAIRKSNPVFSSETFAEWCAEEFAERCANELRVGFEHRVLVPNVGDGTLVHPIVRWRGFAGGTDRLLLVEKNRRHLPALREQAYDGNVVWGDFLELSQGVLGTFDRVVMGPSPRKEVDELHISHALDLLRPTGRLVAIASTGLLDTSTLKVTKAVRSQVFAWGGKIERLHVFKHAGCELHAVLVVVDRPASA